MEPRHRVPSATMPRRYRIMSVVVSIALPVIIGTAAWGLLSTNDHTTPAVAAAAPGTPTPTPGPTPVWKPGAVKLPTDQFVQWALFDKTSNTMYGSSGMTVEHNTTESMVKVWIAADYLARNPNPSKKRLDQIRIMIRDSDNNAAQDLYEALGRGDSIFRMIRFCGMQHAYVTPGWWSQTNVTADDAVRLGLCVSAGMAAGPKWTPWLLNEMRHVRGDSRFGIVDALPAALAGQLAIKNGYTAQDNLWSVNCLAVGDKFVLAIIQRYAWYRGLNHGAKMCADITRQLGVASL